MALFEHKKRLVLSMLVGIVVFFCTNFYYLKPNNIARAISDDYWKGQIDEKIKTGETRDEMVFKRMKEIGDKIDAMCNDIIDIKIQAARNGGLYGAGAGVGVYLSMLFIQTLFKRRNGMGKPL